MSVKRVLLVDDEPDAVEFLQDLLEDNGFEVCTADTAEMGLRQVREQRPDLICLDVLMPEESGISLYQKIRTDPDLGQIPVLFISGLSLSRELSQIHYLELPDGTRLPEPDGVVDKPVEIGLFMKMVEQVLG
ncbi:MAG: response regulator [Deltaproteobacteria bacterium]|nr:MAG: response regulator [Deltaproteobacteria bacterium]